MQTKFEQPLNEERGIILSNVSYDCNVTNSNSIHQHIRRLSWHHRPFYYRWDFLECQKKCPDVGSHPKNSPLCHFPIEWTINTTVAGHHFNINLAPTEKSTLPWSYQLTTLEPARAGCGLTVAGSAFLCLARPRLSFILLLLFDCVSSLHWILAASASQSCPTHFTRLSSVPLFFSHSSFLSLYLLRARSLFARILSARPLPNWKSRRIIRGQSESELQLETDSHLLTFFVCLPPPSLDGCLRRLLALLCSDPWPPNETTGLEAGRIGTNAIMWKIRKGQNGFLNNNFDVRVLQCE